MFCRIVYTSHFRFPFTTILHHILEQRKEKLEKCPVVPVKVVMRVEVVIRIIRIMRVMRVIAVVTRGHPHPNNMVFDSLVLETPWYLRSGIASLLVFGVWYCNFIRYHSSHGIAIHNRPKSFLCLDNSRKFHLLRR